MVNETENPGCNRGSLNECSHQNAQVNHNTPPLAQAALAYAKNGIKIFPTNGKLPLISDWPNKASNDLEQVSAWWADNPNANIGVLTGPDNGITVADVDVKDGGLDTWEDLVTQHGQPDAVYVRTGSGGLHAYFKNEDGDARRIRTMPGIDVLADKSFVVAPPSVHGSGNTYQWLDGDGLLDTNTRLPKQPGWIREIVTGHTSSGGNLNFDATSVITPNGQPVAEGERNSSLASNVGKWIRDELTYSQIMEKALAFGSACTPPMDVEEIIRTTNSVCKTHRRNTGEFVEFRQATFPGSQETIAPDEATDVLETLIQLSATTRINEIEANLDKDEYAIAMMALVGQITLFYAWPGTGKTLLILRLLINAIRDGEINAEDIFYINADDGYKGLLTKSRIAHEHGFHMVSPSEAGIAPKDIITMLGQLAANGQASGKVVVLDTLKKFADMMDKRSQAGLYEILRQFVAKKGTVVLLGHANKHLNANGELVYEGTADTKNDVDCMYSMYRMAEQHAPVMVVEFRCEKDRGDVVKKVSYEYEQMEGMSYRAKLDSIQKLSKSDSTRLQTQRTSQARRRAFESEILFIENHLKNGPANQSQILAAFDDAKGEGLAAETSKARLKNCLEKLTGDAWSMTRERNHNNAKVFSLIEKQDYSATKWGESC